MTSTPAWYALRSLETAPSRDAIAADYPAPLLTRRVFSTMASRILGVRELAPVPVAMRPAQRMSRRPPG